MKRFTLSTTLIVPDKTIVMVEFDKSGCAMYYSTYNSENEAYADIHSSNVNQKYSIGPNRYRNINGRVSWLGGYVI